MQITSVKGLCAECAARGATRSISLFALRDALPAVGDHVMVSMEQAVRQVSAEEARLAWEIYDQILAELGLS
ncbi:MAG: HypC/HybG/HupF family hydrogenase formation chaperone [Rhodoferax sp.]|nr:HypC/HybG/HupF family hydrogenase formation chaperone [Rhodoferax sp.]